MSISADASRVGRLAQACRSAPTLEPRRLGTLLALTPEPDPASDAERADSLRGLSGGSRATTAAARPPTDETAAGIQASERAAHGLPHQAGPTSSLTRVRITPPRHAEPCGISWWFCDVVQHHRQAQAGAWSATPGPSPRNWREVSTLLLSSAVISIHGGISWLRQPRHPPLTAMSVDSPRRAALRPSRRRTRRQRQVRRRSPRSAPAKRSRRQDHRIALPAAPRTSVQHGSIRSKSAVFRPGA